jgi:hypothetical protein
VNFSPRFVTRDRKIPVQEDTLRRVMNDLDTARAIQLEEARVGRAENEHHFRTLEAIFRGSVRNSLS